MENIRKKTLDHGHFLHGKVDDAAAFIKSEDFWKLSNPERCALKMRLHVMDAYEQIVKGWVDDLK